jgi:hypothetical protein
MTSELKNVLVGVMLDQEHGVGFLLLVDSCVNHPLLTVQVGLDVPIMAVDFLVDNMITQMTHVFHASSLGATLDVWRSHVGGVLADDVDQSSFNFEHFGPSLLGVEIVHARVRPGVRANLMTVGVHTFDGCNPGANLVDLALAHVVASDEESGFGLVVGQNVEQSHGVV